MPGPTTTSSRFAYATLVTNDTYAVGAVVLATALRATRTPHTLVCLHAPELGPEATRALAEIFDELVPVATRRSADTANLLLLGRPDLDVTLTKLHVWTLTQYEKVVFLDADTLVLMGIDELFDREELSAAPDCGWPDIFNSGVFVLRPSMDTFHRLVAFASERGSWDGGDQGLLNDFFASWATTPDRRLPFVYNVTPTSVYTYAPAFQRFQDDIKVVHFAGPSKPWQYARTSDGSPIGKGQGPAGDVLLNLVQRWWMAFATIESRFGHLLFKTNVGSAQGHPLSPHSTSGMGAGASWSAGDSAPFTMTPAGASPGAAFQGISMARYSWPEHEMDQASLLDMLRALDLGRPSASLSRITRRRSSGHLQLANMPPSDSGLGGNTPAGRSPKTPTFSGMPDNFGATIESVTPKAPTPTPAAIVTGASASVASPTSPVHSLHGANAEMAAPFMFAGGSAAGEMTSAVDRALDSSPMPTSAVARSVELTQESPVIKPLATRDVFSREPSAAAIATTTSKAAPTTSTTKTTAAPAKTTAAPAKAAAAPAKTKKAAAPAKTAAAPASAKAAAPAKAAAAGPAPTKAPAAANASAPAKTSSTTSPASPSGTSTTAATKDLPAPAPERTDSILKQAAYFVPAVAVAVTLYLVPYLRDAVSGSSGV
ncbi:Glycogenin-1 [Allomyces arbusculus]|nr:Glycogenin-1 [Allomyces arbusculus]